jgi:hypothetical protein
VGEFEGGLDDDEDPDCYCQINEVFVAILEIEVEGDMVREGRDLVPDRSGDFLDNAFEGGFHRYIINFLNAAEGMGQSLYFIILAWNYKHLSERSRHRQMRRPFFWNRNKDIRRFHLIPKNWSLSSKLPPQICPPLPSGLPLPP